ncbi:MAG: AAA family ATPase [Desulfobacteraceae bacterium]|nr:AAA family ATPase [Desulfobacteraceae bacterium]
MPITELAKSIRERPPVSLAHLIGLEKDATQNSPRDKYFFTFPLLKQRLAFLNNIISSQSHALVIIGERGSGKSTLLQNIITEPAYRWKKRNIYLKTGYKPLKGMLEKINQKLIFLSQKNSPPCIFIDDAHELNEMQMQILIHLAFHCSSGKAFQGLTMFAQPRIQNHFDNIERHLPPAAIMHKMNMVALTKPQTANYLKHRIKIAGILKQPLFSDYQIDRIYEASGGLPGKINDEAFAFLRRMYNGKSPFKKPLLKLLTAELSCRSIDFKSQYLRLINRKSYIPAKKRFRCGNT